MNFISGKYIKFKNIPIVEMNDESFDSIDEENILCIFIPYVYIFLVHTKVIKANIVKWKFTQQPVRETAIVHVPFWYMLRMVKL